jgi:hypothetical protein
MITILGYYNRTLSSFEVTTISTTSNGRLLCIRHICIASDTSLGCNDYHPRILVECNDKLSRIIQPFVVVS